LRVANPAGPKGKGEFALPQAHQRSRANEFAVIATARI
jgi:hypothetical protein